MRQSLIFVGIGAVIIIVGIALINHGFTNPQENKAITSMASSSLSLTSTAFQGNASIPSKYTCDAGSNPPSPPLSISGIPDGAKSFALIVTDPDVPKQILPMGEFVHWVLFNIPATTTAIAEGETVGTPGANGAGQNAFAGPCPPPQYEPSEHRYFFTLYALDSELDLRSGASKGDVLKAMKGHIIAETELVGKYKKQK